MNNRSGRPPLAGWLDALHTVETGLLALLLTVIVLLSSAQILLRNFLDTSLAWGDPLLRILVLWVGLLGALAASRDNRQISVDVLSRLLSGKTLISVQAGTALFTAAISALLAYHAARFVVFDLDTRSAALGGLPVWIFESILPVAFALIALRYGLLCAARLRALAPTADAEPADGDPT